MTARELITLPYLLTMLVVGCVLIGIIGVSKKDETGFSKSEKYLMSFLEKSENIHIDLIFTAIFYVMLIFMFFI